MPSSATKTKSVPAIDSAELIQIDRRGTDRRETGSEVVAHEGPQRRKAQRRRQIDPTTCERDYSGDEIEFMQAMDAYKRSAGRMFPTCSEILEVIRAIGYIRLSDQQRELLRFDEIEAHADYDFNAEAAEEFV
jgi:hypothetical protein